MLLFLEAVPQAADCVSEDCVYQHNVKLNAFVLHGLLAERENTVISKKLDFDDGIIAIQLAAFLNSQRMVLQSLLRAPGQHIFE